METTDFSAPWRKKRFATITSHLIVTGAQKAIAANYDSIADNMAIGDAATRATGCELESVDVAMSYLRNTSPNVASGPINASGMAALIGGSSSILNAFSPGAVGDSDLKASYGLGGEHVAPFVTVDKDGLTLRVGRPPRGKKPDKRPGFPLAVVDVTRKA